MAGKWTSEAHAMKALDEAMKIAPSLADTFKAVLPSLGAVAVANMMLEIMNEKSPELFIAEALENFQLYDVLEA